MAYIRKMSIEEAVERFETAERKMRDEMNVLLYPNGREAAYKRVLQLSELSPPVGGICIDRCDHWKTKR